ncbi:MAG: hypothetical protein DMG84_19775 [Acidobacteria bacterium]|nr:MAG: hypothetical protein DMG84_19775 [Acidobacteriota bacterium]
MDLKRAHDWFALQRGLQSFANTVVLLPLVTLCILSRLPEAERQYAIRVRVRDENNLILEPALLLQESSLALPCLLTNSTTRVNIDALLSFG